MIKVPAVSDDEQLSQQLASLHIQREAPRSGGRNVGRIIVVLILLGAASAGGWVVFHKTEDKLFAEEAEIGAVTLVSASQQDVTLVATGYVYSRKKATIAPKVNGRIAKLYVDEGDIVKEGQLLAELDVADAQAQLAQVKADIAASRARVERARADLIDAETKQAREEKLLASGAGTKAATDDAKTHAAALKAQLAAAEADVAASQSRHQAASVSVDNTKIRAPFDGTVIRKLAEVGEVATIAGAGIFTIASLTDLEVQADVSESQLSKVKVGTPAEILLDAFPDRSFVAETKEIRQTVDRAKASVTVKVRFTGDCAGVLPDMAAKVSFRNKKLDDAAKQAPKLVAPSDSVVDRGGRKVVLTVEDGKIREFPVVAGGEVGSMVELTSGPTSGTRVVRHPSEKLKEGSAVKEKDAK
jgi:RND family efflux transporter MFP subunit